MLTNTAAALRKDESGINIKIITWNLWSIFMFSPRCLTNPYRCTDYILSIANKENWIEYDGLMICGFQELWKWNTGIFPSIILSKFVYIFEYIPYFGTCLSRFFQAITFLIGIIPIFKLLSLAIYNNYCPKQIVINKLNKIFKYNYYDNKIPILPLFKISDNGLLLVFNKKPDFYGSQSFNYSKHDDFFANKGFIYIFFEKYNCLIINTHLQYRGNLKIKIKQLNQLNKFLNDFKKKNGQNIKIIILGDFNCDMMNHEKIIKLQQMNNGNHDIANKEKLNISNKNNQYLDVTKLLITDKNENYLKVNSFNSTTRFTPKCIDHIFVNHKITKYKEQIGGKHSSLSDHYCVINDFYSH